MSLCKMDNQRETISLLDEFDVTLAMDSRTQGNRTTQSIDLDVEPIVLRVSYRDVMLVQRIVQKAIDLSNKTAAPTVEAPSQSPEDQPKAENTELGSEMKTVVKSATQAVPPQVTMTRQSVGAPPSL